jgi:hypothetical protein
VCGGLELWVVVCCVGGGVGLGCCCGDGVVELVVWCGLSVVVVLCGWVGVLWWWMGWYFVVDLY